MKKPIDQAAIRASLSSSKFELPDWLGVEKWVYFNEQNCHVRVKGWLGNLVEIEIKGKHQRVHISQLSEPRFGTSDHDSQKGSELLDLSAINHPTYKAIATAFIDDLNAVRVLRGTSASIVPLPDALNSHLRSALKKNGITQFYSHQEKAFSYLQKGRSVAITTPTASGKSLCFLPHVFSLAITSRKTSLLIYPLRALAADQFDKLIAINDALPDSERLVIARCTGDVPIETRKAYFQGTRSPDIIVISPDVLHHQLYHAKNSKMLLWQEFLSRLGSVVCDESHTYTSSFGIHFVNVLRRLRLALYNTNHPTRAVSWVISTATIANPTELASQLSGIPTEEIALIDSSGAKQSERTLLIMQPLAAPNFMGATLVNTLLTYGLKGLLFVNSRPTGKQIFSLLNYQMGGKVNGVDLFHGSIGVVRRRELIESLSNGRLNALITTNALEAGIDLPALDFVILRGSTSLNSFWQRAGRAGRANPGLIIFIPDVANHIDYYYANKCDRLFESAEKVKLQPNYPSVLANHLLCAGAEGGVPAQLVSSYFGEGSDYLAASLHRQDKLYWSHRQVLWSKGYPHGNISLRGLGDNTISLIDSETGELIEEMTLSVAHRECHQGAIYLTTDEGTTITWLVDSLDPQALKASLLRVDNPDVRTTPDVDLNIILKHELDSPIVVNTTMEGANLRLSLWWGTIEELVTGYKQLKLLYAPTCTNRACSTYHQPCEPNQTVRCGKRRLWNY